jgi:hypothetical protein
MIEAIASAPFLAYAEDAPAGLVGTIGVQVRDDHDTVVLARTTAHITEVVAGSGLYQWAAPAAPALPGPYVIMWDTGGGSPSYSSELFQVTPGSAYVPSGDITTVSDLTDLAVLIPWARRACEGPYGPPQGKATLADSTVYPMLADACSEIILFSGSLFGHTLDVTARDPLMGYPTQWKTKGCVLNQWEGAVVICQVALDYWRFLFRDMPVSQSIKNEGTEWAYSLSANVIRDYLAGLRSDRDKALDGLRYHNPVLDRYASTIRVRDQATVATLEWWARDSIGGTGGGGIPGGQEAAVVPWTPGWSGQ